MSQLKEEILPHLPPPPPITNTSLSTTTTMTVYLSNTHHYLFTSCQTQFQSKITPTNRPQLVLSTSTIITSTSETHHTTAALDQFINGGPKTRSCQYLHHMQLAPDSSTTISQQSNHSTFIINHNSF